MRARLRRHRDQDRGASAVEYGLLVAAIAAVIVGVVFGLGKLVDSAFEKTCSAIYSQVQPGCTTPAGTGDGANQAPGDGSDDEQPVVDPAGDPAAVEPPVEPPVGAAP